MTGVGKPLFEKLGSNGIGAPQLSLRGLTLLVVMLSTACGPEGSAGPNQPAPVVAIPPPTLLITGEARVLRGTSLTPLFHSVDGIESVYSFGAGGQKIDYVEGRDWIRSGNSLGRTVDSRIPDFSDYAFASSGDGRFSFSSDPRNPPLTIGYNVYIDYTTQKQEPIVTAMALPRQQSSVLCLGDSIAEGAHTIESFYRENDSQSWCGLLRSALAPSISVRNEAVLGGALRAIGSSLETYSVLPGDTVILAFGMNDHVFEPEGGLATFKAELERVASVFLDRGSNVILVGFFQQNELWDMEDSGKTRLYNDAIQSVAQTEQVPFVDVYAAFESIRVGSDPQFFHLTADFMHHPNIYGQRVYYSQLIPYFLGENGPSSTIPNYVVGPWTR